MTTDVGSLTPDDKLLVLVRAEAKIVESRDSKNRALRVIRSARDHLSKAAALRAEAGRLGIEIEVGEVDELVAILLPYIGGLESKGMILAVSTQEGGFSFLEPSEDTPSGRTIR